MSSQIVNFPKYSQTKIALDISDNRAKMYKLRLFRCPCQFFKKGFYEMFRKWMRTVAIALIVLPEPFTTVIGILLLSFSLAITRQKNLKKFGDLEELIRISMRNGEPVFETVLHHTLKTGIPQYDKAPEAISKSNLRSRGWKKAEPDIQHHKTKLSLVPMTTGGLR
jgi:hypothetical protein